MKRLQESNVKPGILLMATRQFHCYKVHIKGFRSYVYVNPEDIILLLNVKNSPVVDSLTFENLSEIMFLKNKVLFERTVSFTSTNHNDNFLNWVKQL